VTAGWRCGVGVEHPDISNASRRIKKSEQDLCAKNGVRDIVEVKVGYDGIALGQSKAAAPLNLTRKDIFLALAKRVPAQVALASQALVTCDVAKARKVIHQHRVIRDLDIKALEANTRLYAIHQPVASEDVNLAVQVALEGKDFAGLFNAALRRLATYLMEDPRNIRWVIDATLGVKAMERIGNHACSIARNIVYSVTDRDVRHASAASLGG
jgi:phosphate uptake regulator